MSNQLSIAAVTAALVNLLQAEAEAAISGAIVTALPIDKAHSSDTSNQINVFLYHSAVNTAWRNRDVPGQTGQYELGFPAFPLLLYYLVTAYGEDEIKAHRLLGIAIRTIHDNPILSPAEILAGETTAALDGADLHLQQEPVRLTWQPLSLDEIAKIWGGIQMAYRMSVAFEASVVLLESKRSASAPLPVLQRGSTGGGIDSQANVLSPFPTLNEVRYPLAQISANQGDTLTFSGINLAGTGRSVGFAHPALAAANILPLPAGAAEKEFQATIPAGQPTVWPPGLYTASLALTRSGESFTRTTNGIAVALAPKITAVAPNPAARDADDHVTLTITCSPQVFPTQRVRLLLGDLEVEPDPITAQTDTLTFALDGVPTGSYFLRLRVDGVDSPLIVDRTATPPVFDTSQKVTIT